MEAAVCAGEAQWGKQERRCTIRRRSWAARSSASDAGPRRPDWPARGWPEDVCECRQKEREAGARRSANPRHCPSARSKAHLQKCPGVWQGLLLSMLSMVRAGRSILLEWLAQWLRCNRDVWALERPGHKSSQDAIRTGESCDSRSRAVAKRRMGRRRRPSVRTR